MKASQIDRHADGVALWPSWMFSQNIASKARLATHSPSKRVQLGPWLFCFSLWLSSLLAILMSRGWLALFMSGQTLSACGWVFKRLTRPPLSPSAETAKGLEGAFDEL